MNSPRIVLDLAYHVDGVEAIDHRIEAAAAWIARRFELRSLSASVAVVDDPTIHRLNREHLDHDWPTDVVSFVFEDAERHVEGEVIASIDTATRLARQAGWSAGDELLLYVVHGLLHLAGLDDLEEGDRKRMRQAEMECLQALGVPHAAEHLQRWNELSH